MAEAFLHKPGVSNYWIYRNALDDDTIQRIMQIGEGEWIDAATAVGSNHEIRKTELAWSNDQWLYDLFWPMMENANTSAGWNFEVSAAENFTLGKYEDGGHYKFHMDGNGIHAMNYPGNEFLDRKTRKISFVCWLNEDFEGGEFEFHPSTVPAEEGLIKPTKGTVIFFPSWYLHKVHPVTSGTRYALITWFNGYPVR